MRYAIVRYQFPFEKVNYPRPCVVVYKSASSLGLLGISTKFHPEQHPFTIRREHPDFRHTGLTETSYVYGSPVANAVPNEVIGNIGAMTGELAKEFHKWIGD